MTLKKRAFKYPKITVLIAIIVLTYFVFRNHGIKEFIAGLGNWGYLGVFIAGLFYSFGFSSPVSTGFFLVSNIPAVWLAAILGGFGALITDMFIFGFVRLSFMDEFEELEKTRFIKGTGRFIHNIFGEKAKKILLYALAFVFIASPLPDEAGIIILAGLTKISTRAIMIISFVANTLGILVLLSL